MNQLGKKYFTTQEKWGDVSQNEIPNNKRHIRRRSIDNTIPLYSWRDEHSIERFHSEEQRSQDEDQKLRQFIYDHLEHSPYVDVKDLNVEVQDGIVRIQGIVKDKWMLYEAEDVIENIKGIKKFENELEIYDTEKHSHWRDIM